MTRIYLRLSLLMTLSFALCAVVMSALGSTQPLHPALRGFVEGCEDVPQPCWNGIVPGVTTWRTAVRILRDAGYEIDPYRPDAPLIEGQLVYYMSDLCTGVILLADNVSLTLQCQGIQLGDVLEIAGIPEAVSVCVAGTTVNGNLYCTADRLYFYDGGLVVETSWLTFFAPAGIVLQGATDLPNNWHGFISHGLHCKIENIPERFCDYVFQP